MPPAVQKSMSVTILTTIFTSLGITIFIFFGTSTISARDTTIMYQNTAKQVDKIVLSQEGMDIKMDSMLVFISENRMDIAKLDIEAKHCKEDLDECNSHIKDHPRYQ